MRIIWEVQISEGQIIRATLYFTCKVLSRMLNGHAIILQTHARYLQLHFDFEVKLALE